MKKLGKGIKAVSGVLCVVLLFSGIINNKYFVSAKNNGIMKDYVIITDNSKAYKRVLNNFDKNGEANVTEKVSDNNMIVASLSNDEVSDINKESDVLVEENILLEANEKKPGANLKKDFYRRLKNTEKFKNKNKEWNIQAINADNVNITSNQQHKVKVAVLDSGIDFVQGLKLEGSVNLIDEEENVATYFQDLTGHGTNIASVIAANGENNVNGVNPNVELYSVKVLDKDNIAPVSRIIEGIYWCIENNINIINMSFGTKIYSKALKKAVEDAHKANILMIAASGNHNDKVEYPAAFDEVMAVASTNTESEISDFSNTGKELDIAAPGEKVRVLGFFGLNGVTHGTSIAVPQVVGVASLLWEKDLSKTNEFIRSLISYSSRDIANTEDCGLLDAEYALKIYDIFEHHYNCDSKRIEGIPENNKGADCFKEVGDDSNYVEGRWLPGNHQSLIQAGASDYGITDETELAILKAGAIYPDKSNSGIDGGTTDNPQYHGGFKDGVGDPVNYVACYEFVTRIALKNGNASSFKNHKAIYGLGKYNFGWIKADFTGQGVGWRTWNEIFSEIKVNGKSVANNDHNKKYFTWGIALHILGDTFAHKTYRKSDKKQIVHSKNVTNSQITGADDPTVVTNRWAVAKLATVSSIGCLLINDYGDFNEIDYALRNQPKVNNNQKFLKKRLSKYIEGNGGVVNSYIKNANID